MGIPHRHTMKREQLMTNSEHDLTAKAPIDPNELRTQVQEKYREVASDPTAEYHFFTGRLAADRIGYPASSLDALPNDVVEAFAGVSDPFYWGRPESGETVIDVGSGGGLDSVLAAKSVGPDGKVIGVDMTPDMLERGRRSASALGLDNLEFRKGYAEDLPVPDESVDLVISNGVINLVPDKLAAYREVYRVLKPGGRFQVADIVVDKPIPEGTQRNIDLWTG